MITTVAGNGTAGFTGDGGAATSAAMYSPTDLALDGAGNLYISDNANNRIRKVVISTGVITTVAGNGTAGFAGDGAGATSAKLNQPAGLAFDSTGNLYIADVTNNRIRKVAAGTGVITTYAGNGIAGFLGDGGAATSAELNTPARITLDRSDNLYIADQANNRVRKVTLGVITTVAGNGTAGYTGDGGPATSATFDAPLGIALDNAGSFYVSDFHNNVIRKLSIADNSFPATSVGASSATQTLYLQVTADETITSITVPQSLGGKQEYTIETITGCTVDGTTVNSAGTVCQVPITFTPAYPGRRWAPLQVVTSAGNINFGLQGVGVGPLAALTPGIITTFAGSGTAGYAGDGGAATSAKLNNPFGLALDNSGNLYIADFNNGSIRKVNSATGIITTYAGTGVLGYSGDSGPATSAQLQPPRMALDSAGNLYIADYYNSRVRKVAAGSGIITTIAGTGVTGYGGDGGSATSAVLNRPAAVAIDDAGNIYIADANNARVRKIAAGSGIITTIAGTGTVGYGGDGGPATSALLNNPAGLAIDGTGNLYFSEFSNHCIRKIDAVTGIITTAAGVCGSAGYSGDGGAATSAKLNGPEAVSLDNAGNLYIADSTNNRIRRVAAATGIITTIVGTGTAGNAGDGGPANAAKLYFPAVATVDGAGSLYVADARNNVIRKIDLSQSSLIYPTPTTVGTSDSTDNPQSVLLSNIGNDTLTIPPPGSGSNPSVSSNFAFNSSTSCPQLSSSSSAQTLASGADCTIAIDFKPIQAGALTGTAVETDNSLNVAGSTQVIRLTATGVAASTATTVTSSANPSIYAQSVTFTAAVAPTAGTALPTGTVQFSIDGTPVGAPVTLANGTAVYSTSTLGNGSHTVAAVYTPDTGDFATSSGSLSQGVSGLSTKIVGAPTPNPSMYGQVVTVTVSVVPTNGTGTPTGTIHLNAGAIDLGILPLNNGTVTFSTSTLPAGKYNFNALYQTDSPNFQNALGSIPQFPVRMVVNPLTTTTTVASSVNPAANGQSITFTAAVAPTVGTLQPTGTVQFTVDGTPSGSPVTLSNGTANFAISTLSLGLHTIAAVYTPDSGNFAVSNGSIGQRVGTSASSTTTLTVTPGTVMYGDPATLTATVTPSFATGTVSFFEGTTLLGTASLDNTGTAVLPISTLNVGADNIVAKYNGDPGVPASTSSPAQLAVTQRTAPGGGPAITVTVNDAVRTTTQSNPPFTYSASGQLVNSDTYATAINGTAAYSTAAGTTPGTFSITVAGLNSANYAITFVPGTLAVTTTPTTTTLTAGPATPQYGDAVTLTATVSAGATGTISFYDGTTFLGSGTVVNGVATLTTSTLPAGTHNVTAVYNGDTIYASSQSDPVTVNVGKKTGPNGGAALTITVQDASREYGTSDPQFIYVVTGALVNGDRYATAVAGVPTYSAADQATSATGSTFPITVNGLTSSNYEIAFVPGTLTIVAAPTTTALGPSTASAQYGDPATLTATVGPSSATGTVAFMQGSMVLGTAPVTNGVATLTTSSLPAGNYTITSTYEGDANYSASTSGPVTVTIQPKAGPNGEPALTVTVNDATREYGGGNPAFTYTISGSLVNGDTYAGAITGVPVYSTTATPSSAAGKYPISMVGGLNSGNYVVGYVNGTLTVDKAAVGQGGTTNITLTSTPDPAVPNKSVTFTASVPPGVTGTITFMDGGVVLGTATINGTTATLTTTLPSGTHSVTAVYNGDANHTGATSNINTVIVGQPSALDFTLTLTSANSQTVLPGQAAPYAVRVAPTSTAYPGTVTFSATGLPAGATINFSPATVAPNAGPTPSSVSIQTAPQKVALNKDNAGSLVLALLLLPFATSRQFRRSPRRYLFLAIILLGGIAATTGLTGCGSGNGFFGQAPKTYNIVLTATSGTIQHSVNVTLEVQ